MKSNPIIIRKTQGLSTGRGARVAIPGVFPSASRFGEQVVKLRVPSLDTYIGGGIPIGSICLIKDEFPSKFGDMVLKSFVADGASYNHRLYIATGHISPTIFSKELPSIKKPSSDSTGGLKHPQMENDGHMSAPDLKIAWRYGHQSSTSGVIGSLPSQSGVISVKSSEQHQPSFDFSKRVSAEELGGKNVKLSQVCESVNEASNDDKVTVNFTMPKYDPTEKGSEILSEILQVVNDLDTDSPKPPSNICRIAISHLEEEMVTNQFLLKLRSVVQNTNSCAVVVISEAALQTKNISTLDIACLEHLSDIVISLQSVVDQKRRSELGGIDGICNIVNLASNSTLKVVEPPKDVGFSFKKKRLVFHELHLPPEGENTTQRETSSSSNRVSAGGILPSSLAPSCGTAVQGKRIDF